MTGSQRDSPPKHPSAQPKHSGASQTGDILYQTRMQYDPLGSAKKPDFFQ